MMTEDFYLPYIANAVGVKMDQVKKTLDLLQGGATIPFIARYRKEVTSHLDEVKIAEIQRAHQKLDELVSRKQTVLEAIDSQGKLTPELRERIEKCMDAIELEDIYLPYKKKRKTKADVAREKGLDELAQLILAQKDKNIFSAAGRFISDLVADEEEALQGARDIIAETVHENENCRDYLRNVFRKHGVISSKVVKTKAEEATVYKDYFEFSEPVQRCPSHRYLAMI